MIKIHIHVVCAVVLCCFIVLIVNIYEYTLDEDISQIEFKEFNSDESHIYPSVTLCLTNPLLDEKLNQFGQNVNSKTYTDFINGDLWDRTLAQIEYDDVSIDFSSYLLGFHMFETTSWKIYRYRHNKSSKSSHESDSKNSTMKGWPPKFYTSSRGLFGKCWSVELPYIHQKTIQSFGILFHTDIFKGGIRPPQNEFGVIIHYPQQLLKADIGMYDWKSLENDNSKEFTMKFEIRNAMVVKRRQKSILPCNELWKQDDDMIYKRMYSKAGCKPPYSERQVPNDLKTCTSKEEMKMLYKSMLNVKSSPEHPQPCQEIEKIIFSYDELSWLVDDWINDANANDTNASENKTKNMFEVLLNFNDGTYMEIQNAKSYDTWTLLGNAGGYVGLFLGYSLLQLFLQLPKVVSKLLDRVLIIKSNLKISRRDFDSNDQLELQEQSGLSESTLLQDPSKNDTHLGYSITPNNNGKRKYELIKKLILENITIKNKIIEIKKDVENLTIKYNTLNSFFVNKDEITDETIEHETYI